MITFQHTPVLAEEVLSTIDNNPSVYLDLTSGGGNHAARIIDRYPEITAVLIDRDDDAIAHLKEKFAGYSNVKVVKSAFSNLDKVLFLLQISKVDLILADLGVSSFQFDTAERGFSFRLDGPMDMRMDQSAGLSALDYIRSTGEGELRSVLSEYGGEREAGRMARLLKKCVEEGMTTTTQFAEAISKAKRFSKKGIDPATQIFMSLRMAVNNELGELESGLKKGFSVLSEHGIMSVISFHSTEDRIVKNFFRNRKNGLPFYVEDGDEMPFESGRVMSVELHLPSEGEIAGNPRSRSAKLRVLKK